MADLEIADFPYMMLGALVVLREKSEQMAKGMVEKGKEVAPTAKTKMDERKKATEKAAESIKKKGIQRTDDLTNAVGDTVEKVLGQMGLITKSDIESLDKKLASLERKINKKAKEAETAKKAKTSAKK